jgi:dynamin 1-like protein
MEKTTENRLVLEGKSIPVKLGIIGVINRNQIKIDEGQPISKCLEEEELFFKTNYNYISGEMGTPYLTKRLCQILMEHVKECLPDLILRITEQKVIQQNILDSLGTRVDDPFAVLIQLLYKFCQSFDSNIEGRESIKLSNGREISGGRHLFQQFENTIGSDLENLVLPEDIEKQIEEEIMSSSGAKPALFTPNITFENLASNQIKVYVQPVKRAIKKCCETITEVTMLLSKNVFKRFPNLKREAHHICLTLIMSKTQDVERFLDDYLRCELCYINTNHRLFTKDRKRIEAETLDGDIENLPFEQQNVKKIKALLELYSTIIKNQLMDVVPKTVMSFMVYGFKEELHNELVKRLADRQKVGELMKEDIFIEEKREKAAKMLEALEKADAVTCLLD